LQDGMPKLFLQRGAGGERQQGGGEDDGADHDGVVSAGLGRAR
jgi:hypothetical protein